MATDAQRADLIAWLTALAGNGNPQNAARAQVALNILAEPRLPQMPPPALIKAMITGCATHMRDPYPAMTRVYGALYAAAALPQSPASPQTQEVDVWRISWSYRQPNGHWKPTARTEMSLAEANQRLETLTADDNVSCIDVEGPVKQTMPVG